MTSLQQQKLLFLILSCIFLSMAAILSFGGHFGGHFGFGFGYQ